MKFGKKAILQNCNNQQVINLIIQHFAKLSFAEMIFDQISTTNFQFFRHLAEFLHMYLVLKNLTIQKACKILGTGPILTQSKS